MEQIKTKVFRRCVKVVKPNEFFGFEDILQGLRQRIFEARVSKECSFFEISRDTFLRYFCSQDLAEFIRGSKHYTDFERLGLQQMQDFQQKHERLKSFEHSVGFVVAQDDNQRSYQSWLGNSEFSYKRQRVRSAVMEHIKQMKTKAEPSKQDEMVEKDAKY